MEALLEVSPAGIEHSIQGRVSKRLGLCEHIFLLLKPPGVILVLTPGQGWRQA